MSRLLEVRNLTAERGGVRTLEVPELHLDEGEVLALIGPNGAGKSTLLQALARLIPVGGELRCRGEVVEGDRSVFAWRRRLAMVFQEPLLFDTTVEENVASGLKIRSLPRGELQMRVAEALEMFGITGLAGRSARRLSGGEAQRTSLARAFAVQPEVILLDEPFSALDPPTRMTLTDDLVRILHRTGTAAVVATHDQTEALRLADRLAVLRGGRIVQVGPPSEVMSFPGDEFVATFVGMENVLAGEVARAGGGVFALRVPGGELEVVGEAADGERVVGCIHPENVVLTDEAPQHSSARNVYPARVERVVRLGGYAKIYLDCGFRLVASVTNRSVAELDLQPGKSVTASCKATAVHVFRKG
ncbi:MAG TPA: ABC transporter ATP-binding protein [Verrucomicrobiae bacterium]|nr:ABC transporter ATP-binding protein [Verrucomicrobiae bacterium]